MRKSSVTIVVSIFMSLSGLHAFSNEIVLQGTVVSTTDVKFINVDRLDRSLFFETNHKSGANITFISNTSLSSQKLIKDGEALSLPFTYTIFDAPLVVGTPVELDTLESTTLAVDISIN